MACTGVSLPSSHITCLDFLLTWDISGAQPVVTITNNSTVIKPATLNWWFYIVSPSGVAIKGVNLNNVSSLPTPDITGTAWTTRTFNLPTPFTNSPCGQIEFSPNSPYGVYVFVQDTSYVTSPVTAFFQYNKNTIIVRPNGNTMDSCGNFGQAIVSMQVDCLNKAINCYDSTNLSYNNILTPIASTWNWTLVYPQGENGEIPNEVITGSPNVTFATSIDSEGYTLYLREYATYDYGNGITVIVQYKLYNTPGGTSAGIAFALNCNTNLCQLQCQMQEFYQLSKGSCGTLENANLMNQMTQMNFLYAQVLTGIFQPLCGIDVPGLIKEIKAIGKFSDNCNCNCGGGVMGFSNPTGGGSNPSGSSCCPIYDNIINKATGTAPAACPGSYFPVTVFAPDGTTQIGVANDINDLVGLVNANEAWMAYGTAFPVGNCQIGIYPAANVTTAPSVYVLSTGASPILVNVYQSGSSPLQSPAGCPNALYPLSVYNPTGTTVIGVANNAAGVLSIINAYPAWQAYGVATAFFNCQVQFTPATGVVSIPPVYVSNTGSGSGTGTTPSPVVVPIYQEGTTAKPTACPASFYPVLVYNYANTETIGIASSVTELVGILNSDPTWSAIGVATVVDNCDVSITPNSTSTTTINPVFVNTNTTGTGCINNQQLYSVGVTDYCNGAAISTLNFPGVYYVQYGSSTPISLGSMASETALLTALTAEPSKPSTISYAPLAGSTSQLQVTVSNTNCGLTSSPVTIYSETVLGDVILIGGNIYPVLNYSSPSATPSFGGLDEYYLPLANCIGKIPGISASGVQWHVVTIGSGTLYAIETNTGKVYVVDVTNPTIPIITTIISLNKVVSNNFSGYPSVGGTEAFYNTYFTTDYNANSATLFIVESTSGTLWQINTTTNAVVTSFQNGLLLGKCPRVLVNNILYFTQDGYVEQAASLTSGVGEGYIVQYDTTSGSPSGLSTHQILLNNAEYVWSASYDAVNNLIYFVGKAGTIAIYSLATNTVTTRYANKLAVTFTFSQNTKYYNNTLYVSGFAVGTLMVSTTSLSTAPVTAFSPLILPGGTGVDNKSQWNFSPIQGRCYGVLTYNSDNVSQGAGIALYSLTGTLIELIWQRDLMHYNVIQIPKITSIAGSTLLLAP